MPKSKRFKKGKLVKGATRTRGPKIGQRIKNLASSVKKKLPKKKTL